jgi:hypothetical protein
VNATLYYARGAAMATWHGRPMLMTSPAGIFGRCGTPGRVDARRR